MSLGDNGLERIRSIIEQRFRLIWMTIACCLIGIMLYERTRVELLPASTQNSLAIALTSHTPLNRATQALLDGVIRESTSSAGIAKHVRTESSPSRVTAFVSVKENSNTDIEALRGILKANLLKVPTAVDLQIFRMGASSVAVMNLIVTSKQNSKASADFISEAVNNRIVPRLSQLSSVALVEVTGLPTRQITLRPNPAEVRASGSSLKDLMLATAQLTDAKTSFLTTSFGRINLDSRPSGTKGFENAELPIRGGVAPTVGTVFSLSEEFSENQPMVLQNGRDAILLDIYKSDRASEVDTSRDVRKLIGNLMQNLPNLKITIASDSANYIQAAQDNVMENLKWGIILTCLCILIFVRNLRYTIIVSISIPVSLALSFLFFPMFGVTRNVMSLAGVTLSVGVVVDATISIIDSIDENMAAGFSPIDSAARAVRDNFLPILSTALTTFAVFIPILFVPGTVGDLFSDLSLTVIVSQLVAFAVAILVIPGVTSLLYEVMNINLQNKEPKKSAETAETPETNIWSRLFMGATKALTATPVLYWSVSIVLLLVALWSISIAPPSEFLPRRKGDELRAMVGPVTRLSDLSKQQVMHRLDNALRMLDAKRRLIVFREDELRADFTLKQASDSSLLDLEERLSQSVTPYRVRLAYRNPIDPQASNAQDLDLFTTAKTDSKRRAFANKIDEIPGVAHQLWTHDYAARTGHFQTADRRSMALPAPPDQAFALWRYLYADTTVGLERDTGGTQETPRPVVVKPDEHRPKIHPVLTSPAPDEPSLFLESIAHEPARSNFYDGDPVQKIVLTIRDRTANEVASAIERIARELQTTLLWGEGKEESDRSIQNLGLCFLIATIIIVAILLIQTRSVATTIIILFTFVWGLIGSFVGLVAHRETLNASAIVGFILLAGTIVNNGILLMELVQRQRSKQVPPRDSCLNAVSQRTLPVLVTAFTTAVGMIPMVFDSGEGSQMYRALSIVVVYGTSVSTPISLAAIPCMVMIFNDITEWMGKLKLRIAIHGRIDVISKEQQS
jgi:HAE1 family hydrophobic/amphiphilic exporter-1